jgi:hypothetical protein
MNHAPIHEDTRPPTAIVKARPSGKSFRSAAPPGVAERVARGMIARHGADAAREATVNLNRMIDRGDLAARDLWACVVHLIHERRD